MAPQASLFSYDWNLDLAELRERAPYLSVSTHAYGYRMGWASNPACSDSPTWMGRGSEREDRAFGKYGVEARAIDAIAASTDLLMVWSAGNERLDVGASGGDPHYHFPNCTTLHTDDHASELELQYDTMGLQLAAKNTLVVGATAHVTHHPPEPGEISVMPFSSFGPMDDGRIKPDLVASGALIYSTVADADDAYGTFSGTSSSAAVVAGAVALLTEYSRSLRGVDLSADEMKALLIQAAVSQSADGAPNYEAGYGLLDARAAADLLTADAGLPEGWRQVLRATLEDYEPSFRHIGSDEIASGTPLRVTLAWMDPPADVNQAGLDDDAPAIVNDLDLTLIAPDGSEHHAWSLDRLDPSAPATRAEANRVDNIEVVDVPASANTENGVWQVRVASDRAPYRHRPQFFALATSVPLYLDEPMFSAPRTVFVETPAGSAPATKEIALRFESESSSSLAVAAREAASWLSLSMATLMAPAMLTLSFDTTGLEPGDYFTTVSLDYDGVVGPHAIGVVLRVTCAADCTGRECGADPVCGELCGGCAAGETCDAAGQCSAWGATCPAADLGSQVSSLVALGPMQGAGDESTGSCDDGDADGEDVAFAWTAPDAGTYRIGTDGSSLDTVLYVLDDCDGSELACSDRSEDATGALSISLTGGQHIVVVVDGESADATGTFHLSIQRALCSDADLGALLAQPLTTGSTVGAVDRLAGTCTGAGTREAVFTWTAPETASYAFSVEDSATPHSIYVLEDGCEGAELACADAEAGELTNVALSQGQRLAIVVEGEGNGGDFALSIRSSVGECAGSCDGSPNDGSCFCDAACVELGDCCDDACELCGSCCEPQCDGKQCGADGCGGVCGECEAGALCDLGLCIADACAELDNGSICDDGDGCTRDDRCIGGRCGGLALICDDGDACTIDACDVLAGSCVNDSIAGCCDDDHDCDDEDACTLDSCVDGTCRAVDDPDCETELEPPHYTIADAGEPDASAETAARGADCGCGVIGASRRDSGAALVIWWALVCAILLPRRMRALKRHMTPTMLLIAALACAPVTSACDSSDPIVEPEPESPPQQHHEPPPAMDAGRDTGVPAPDTDAEIDEADAGGEPVRSSCGPEGECDPLDPQSCDDAVCVVATEGEDLSTTCIEAGSGRDGEGCETSGDCGPGLDCTSFDGAGTCRRYCCEINQTSGCPGGQYCRVALSDMSVLSGIALCDACDGCDLTDNDCADGFACYALGGDCTACLPQGAAALGADCVATNDCAAGSACFRTEAAQQARCIELCEDARSGCHGEFTCREVAGVSLPAGIGLCL